jgi:hypothetical protein
MRPFAIALAGAAALAILPQPARACTMTARVPPPTQADIEEGTRQVYARSEAVVDVVAVEGSRFDRTGRMRVVRVYKGNLAPGALIDIRPLPDSMCGVNDFATGSSGLVMISRLAPPPAPFIFQGYIPADQVAMLRRSGLLPPAGGAAPAPAP